MLMAIHDPEPKAFEIREQGVIVNSRGQVVAPYETRKVVAPGAHGYSGYAEAHALTSRPSPSDGRSSGHHHYTSGSGSGSAHPDMCRKCDRPTAVCQGMCMMVIPCTCCEREVRYGMDCRHCSKIAGARGDCPKCKGVHRNGRKVFDNCACCGSLFKLEHDCPKCTRVSNAYGSCSKCGGVHRSDRYTHHSGSRTASGSSSGSSSGRSAPVSAPVSGSVIGSKPAFTAAQMNYQAGIPQPRLIGGQQKTSLDTQKTTLGRRILVL